MIVKTMPYKVQYNDVQSVFGGAALLICATILTLGSNYALDQQALHDRGRVVQAIVVSSETYATNDGAGTAVTLTYLSGQPIQGTLDDDLAVGQRVTVTVSPDGAVPPMLGGRPSEPAGLWWTLAAFLAMQAAVLAWYARAWARDQ